MRRPGDHLFGMRSGAESVSGEADTGSREQSALLAVIASEAKQSIPPLAAAWIASSLRSSQ
jgi:hypothetical protein